MRKAAILLFVLIFLVPQLISANLTEPGHNEENHNYHIGFGVAGTHFIDDNGIKPGFHLHFARLLGAEKRWGIGLGYEGVVGNTLHNGLNLSLNYKPVHFLSLNIGPGVSFGKHETGFGFSPGGHAEAVFEFTSGSLHLGPMIGAGFDGEDRHFSLGLHIGIGF